MNCEEQTVIVDSIFDTDEVEVPVGKRYGSELLKLTPEHLQAMQQGKVLAVDMMREYVLFIELAETSAHDAKEDRHAANH